MKRLLLVVLLLFTFIGTASATKVTWHRVGASIFGGFCGPSEVLGYRGAYLPDHPFSFAELGNGGALGGLPNETKLRLLSPQTKRRAWVTKRDIGAGGNSVNGLYRAIDLYAPAAAYLAGADCNWTGEILYRKLIHFRHGFG